MIRKLLLLLAAMSLCLPACKSVRTVTAGPRVISEGGSDYNAEQEAKRDEIGRKAAASGVLGQADQGGSNFGRRFGTYDPHGYGTSGLNAMSEKMFGGNTSSRDMKSFTQTRDFLTKRYTNTRELGQKESFTQRMRSWVGGKKADIGNPARESRAEFYNADKVLANKSNYNDGRTIKERSSYEAEKMAATRHFYPAKKVLDGGYDAPRIIASGDKNTNDAVTRLVKSRPRDNPATVEEIRALLGKSQ